MLLTLRHNTRLTIHAPMEDRVLRDKSELVGGNPLPEADLLLHGVSCGGTAG